MIPNSKSASNERGDRLFSKPQDFLVMSNKGSFQY